MLIFPFLAYALAAPTRSNLFRTVNYDIELWSDKEQLIKAAEQHDHERVQIKCGRYLIVAARGTTEDQDHPLGSKNLIERVGAAVPGGRSYQVHYNATFQGLLTNPEIGAVDMASRVALFQAACPDQKLVLFAYSQGAMVMYNAINTPEMRSQYSNIKAIVIYGNPYYRAGLPQNRGTATTGTGIGVIKNVVEKANTLPVELQGVTRDYCHQGDAVCQGVRGNTIAPLVLERNPQHKYRDTKEELDAISFVIDALKRAT